MKVKKVAVLLCVVLFFVIMDGFSVEAANAGGRTRRSIAIVFDNSDSMVRDSGEKHEKSKYLERWAQATYALRTFMHMVNEDDVVHLYTVDNGSFAADKGEVTKDTIDDKISKMGVSYVTKMYGMEKAYHWAEGQKNTEKWVVILTDGKFYKNEKNGRELSANESVGKYINKFKSRNINTICVGLGLERKAEKELKELDDGKHCSVFCTSKNQGNYLGEDTEINRNILKISKKIYTMERLDDKQIRKESNKEGGEFSINEDGILTWETNTEFSKYIQEVIIMAQAGDFAKKENKKNMDSGMEVIYSDRDFAWADKDAVKRFNENALKYYGNYSYLIDRKLIKKIDSSCYIKHYYKNDLDGNKIKFKLPKGRKGEDYTYQIYYVLDAKFKPVLKKGKTEFISENQKNFITEGSYYADYNVISPDGEKISKKLLAVRNVKNNIELKIGSKNVEPGSNRNFDYNDTENKKNQYVMSVTYNTNISNDFQFTTEPDLTKYGLYFWSRKQDVNIDRENENKIFLKLTWKNNKNQIYYWLKNKINDGKNTEEITYNFKNKDGTKSLALGVQLEEAEIVEKKNFIKIGLPVKIANSNEIKMDEHYWFSISLSNKADVKLTAENGDIQITQEEPRVFLEQTEITVIEKLKNDASFNISYAFGNKTDVEIDDVEIDDIGLKLETEDKPECLSFKFNKENGRITCKININIIKYFFSGVHNDKLSYSIHLKRNGKDYSQKEDHELVKFQWKINSLLWSVILGGILLIIVMLAFLAIAVRNGSLLLNEFLCKNYEPGVFPIVWKTPLGEELVVDNKIFKGMKTLRISPRFNKDLENSLENKKIILTGIRKGYYLKNFDELGRLKGISVENRLLENTGDCIIIKLENMNKDNRRKQPDSSFRIVYKNERERTFSRVLFISCSVAAVLKFILILCWFRS